MKDTGRSDDWVCCPILQSHSIRGLFDSEVHWARDIVESQREDNLVVRQAPAHKDTAGRRDLPHSTIPMWARVAPKGESLRGEKSHAQSPWVQGFCCDLIP